MDAYGDGINGSYGLGTYTVKDASGTTIASGGVFTDGETKAFRSGTAGLEELAIEGFNVYPNPASSIVNVAFQASNADYTVSLLDIQGRVLSSTSYSNLSDAQVIEVPVSGLSAGNYFVKVVSNDAMSIQKVAIR